MTASARPMQNANVLGPVERTREEYRSAPAEKRLAMLRDALSAVQAIVKAGEAMHWIVDDVYGDARPDPREDDDDDLSSALATLVVTLEALNAGVRQVDVGRDLDLVERELATIEARLVAVHALSGELERASAQADEAEALAAKEKP